MKKRILLICLICMVGFVGVGQTDSLTIDSLLKEKKEAVYQKWYENLYEFGVERKGDSIIFNDEAKRLINDSNYHNAIYPDVYYLQVAQTLIKSKALKPAFWYLINLYSSDSDNKSAILNIIIPFDKIMEIDKILIATYYSYIGFDPEVYEFKNGKTGEVKRPDIAEQKLLATKEIVNYVLTNRTNRLEN